MPLRFFIPLPGPFVWVRKSRAERELERQASEVRREERADQTMEDHYRRGMFFVGGFWALMTWVAIFYGHPVLAVGIAALGIAHVIKGHQVEQERRAAEANPPGDESST